MSFERIAPYLTNPLVLAGFGLLLFFGLHRALVRSKLLPPVSAKASSGIIRLILHYGFIVAVLVILLGFGVEALKQILHSREVHERNQVLSSHPLTRIEVEEIVQTHRASIEQCIENHSDWTFLNFAIQGRSDGGLNIDVLAGIASKVENLGHIFVPQGQYTRDQFEKLIDTGSVKILGEPTDPGKKAEIKKWLLTGLGDDMTSSKAKYESFGNTILIKDDLGKKLSLSYPDINRCILGVLQGSFTGFSGTPDNQPLIHRYITDTGIKEKSESK